MANGRQFIEPEAVQALKRDADGLREEFRPAGRGRLFVCPFCKREKLSVFTATDGAALWHCYQCGRGGDVFGLYQLRDGLSFYDAVDKVLQKRGGLYQQQQDSLPAAGAAAACLDEWRQRCKAYCLTAAARLWAADGARGLEYLRGRGFTDDTLQRFRFGFDARATAGGSLTFGVPAVIVPYSRKLDYFLTRLLRPFSGSDGKQRKAILPAVDVAGREPVFNAAALWGGAAAVFVVEGWADAAAIVQASAVIGAGVSAVAINGAGNHGALLALLRTRPAEGRLFISLDADAAGVDGARALSAKLNQIGQQHTTINSRAVWGQWVDDSGTACKDAGEVLQRFGTDTVAACIDASLTEPALQMPD